MRNAKFNSKSGLTVVELMIAVGLSVGVVLISTRLSMNASQTVENAITNGMGTTSMRESIIQAGRDPLSWVASQTQADTLNGGWLKNCLSATSSSCPASDSTITDPDILTQVPPGGAVNSLPLFIPSKNAPVKLADFESISGSTLQPLYLDDNGARCTTGSPSTQCIRMATGYMVRQYASTGSTGPGAIKFIVKMSQNQNAAILRGSPKEVTSIYTRINVGTAWKGATAVAGPIPVGTIVPFAGPETAVPPGYLLCNGQSYPTTTYAQLAAVLNPNATPNWPLPGLTAPAGFFYVPDLRGVYLRGLDEGALIDVDGKNRSVGSFQAQAYVDHSHASGVPSPLGLPVSASGSISTTVSQVQASFGALTSGSFAPSSGGYEYSGSPNNGLTSAPGGSVSGNVSMSAGGIGLASPVALSGIGVSAVIAPTAPAAANDEVRPTTTYVHYIIRADYK